MSVKLRKFSKHINESQLLLAEIRAVRSNKNFSIQQVQTYNAFTKSELANIADAYISKQSLRTIIKNGIGLDYFLIVFEKILQQYRHQIHSRYSVQVILKILLNGQFYRHLDKQLMVNQFLRSRSMQTNVKAIIAAVLTYSARKLEVNQIIRYMSVFQLEQRLNGTVPHGIFFQPNKISKVLYKIGRDLKPSDIKNWFYDLKGAYFLRANYIQCYQFIYLASLASRRDNQDGNFVLMKDVRQGKQNNVPPEQLYPQMNKKVISSNKAQEERRIIGLNFVARQKSKSLSEINFTNIKINLIAQQKSVSLLIKNTRVRLNSVYSLSYNNNCLSMSNQIQQIHAKNLKKCSQIVKQDRKSKYLKIERQLPKIERDLSKIERELPKIERDLSKIERELPKIDID